MTDCGAFVATVMHASGVDTDYPKVGTFVQYSYLRNNPDKYEIIESPSSTADLQPGDILIFTAGVDGGVGHTMIFVGPQTGPDGPYTAVDASLNLTSAGHTPQAEPNPASMFSKPGVIVARHKGTASGGGEGE